MGYWGTHGQSPEAAWHMELLKRISQVAQSVTKVSVPGSVEVDGLALRRFQELKDF